MNTSEKKLFDKIFRSLPGITEGVLVQAYLSGEKQIDIAVGKTYRYYDVASLTKIIFSVTQMMILNDQNKVRPSESVRAFLPWYRHREVKWSDLLTHSSGHKAWNNYFVTIMKDPDRQQKSFTELMRPLLEKEELNVDKKSVYSDLSLLTIGCLFEKIYDKPLLQIWQELNARLELGETAFHVNNRPPKPLEYYAPTEVCKWRNKIIQGEVHDDNTWSLKGVSTHAGLFSTIHDVAKWGLKIRAAHNNAEGVISQPTIKQFTTKATNLGDWALGFMMPSRPKSSCGKYFSLTSVGHTGFTGTSWWWDIERDLMVVVLSNRTYPSRDNKKFPEELRPNIHDWIFEILQQEGKIK